MIAGMLLYPPTGLTGASQVSGDSRCTKVANYDVITFYRQDDSRHRTGEWIIKFTTSCKFSIISCILSGSPHLAILLQLLVFSDAALQQQGNTNNRKWEDFYDVCEYSGHSPAQQQMDNEKGTTTGIHIFWCGGCGGCLEYVLWVPDGRLVAPLP